MGLRRARRLPLVVALVVLLSATAIEPFTSGGPVGATGPTRPALSIGAPAAASGSAAVAAAAGTSSGSLLLTYQTPWVTPGQPFDLKLRTGSGVPSASALGVSVSVYGCLTSVSSFDQAATSSSPSGTPISRTTTPLAWSSLHADPVGSDLSLGVNTSSAASSTISAPNPAMNIHSSNGSCQEGVFPVRLQLVNTGSGDTIASLTTFMVYVTSPAAQRLRFAMVLPVSTSVGPASQPTAADLLANPLAALTRPSAATLGGLNQLVTALGTGPNPSVPVTLAPSAQTLQALTAAGHSPSVTALAALSDNPVHQFASTPYTPVDASALVDAGLGSELVAQLGRGSQVLTEDGIVHTTTPPPGGSAPWITNDGLDDSTLAQLATSGYNQLILPPADVTSSPVNGSGAEPFNIDSTHGSSLLAITSNTDLATRMTAHPGDPVLAASQLLGELAQIYFEYPNLSSPRAVVAVPPTGSSPNPIMIGTLLTDLSNNPFVQGVTAAGLFQALPTPASCRGGCKLTSSSGSSGSSNNSGLPVSGIHNQRNRIAGLASAIPAASPIAQSLPHQFSDLVLASESENLKPAQQSSVIHNTGAALNAQLSQVSVSGDQSITLTSRNAQIPVSIASRAPYPITGTLTLTSDELLFANGTRRFSRPVVLSTVNTPVYIAVQARTSGESKLEITFSSPADGMVITSGVITVRSTATSIVGVALSLGAVAVLLAWWLRTSFRRRQRHRAHALAGSS